MKEVIKLILINFMMAQGLAPLLTMIPCVGYQLITTGSIDKTALFSMITIPGLLVGQILMMVYLWESNYLQLIPSLRTSFATHLRQQLPLFPACLLAILSAAVLTSVLSDYLRDIPNIMEQTFNLLQANWEGILIITLIGPVFEEVFFRGVLTTLLLKRYQPIYALLLSGLFFGICHINPAQIIPAFLIGIFFAWIFYRTHSLLPGIFMHIVNNSISVFLNLRFPQVKHLDELIQGEAYAITFFLAALLCIGSLWYLQQKTKPQHTP